MPSDHSWYWLSDEYSLSQEKLNDTCLEPKLTHPIKTNSDLEHTQSSMITTSKRVGLYLDLLQYFFESEEREQQEPHKLCLQHLAVLTTPKHVNKTHQKKGLILTDINYH